ncbi:cystine transporter permease [Salipaludibacillus neizhouensis]|uniref:Cystine transporter permease n=1 Tax=Salipaludibacillus neizhouensis TaxID=885475 RepID=A0A3A9K9F6_9BACI|nr:amino acid ABC transporter permease [Salipaludibacillus neizhouensis]RKL66283.1 cystine transporter permease [Salipaludibacillus neizhouensis]
MDLLDMILRTIPGFWEAAWITLKITFVSVVIGGILGVFISLLRSSSSNILCGIARVYISFIQGIPLIVQISILYFGISSVFDLSNFWAGAIALGIYSSTSIAGIFRRSMQRVDQGQMEAAKSLGMNKRQIVGSVIGPQALKLSIAPMANQFIITLKDSSLVYIIGIADIFAFANREGANSFQQFEAYLTAGLYYLILVSVFSYVAYKLENHFDTEKRNQRPIQGGDSILN